MTDRESFLEQLKRRKVVRAGMVYGAVAFAVVEAADVFVPALGLPEWILTAVALLAILGFPLTVALAWAFDLTPRGVKRAGDARVESGAESARWLPVRSWGCPPSWREAFDGRATGFGSRPSSSTPGTAFTSGPRPTTGM